MRDHEGGRVGLESMAEALRLTRAGRLADATPLLRSALPGGRAPGLLSLGVRAPRPTGRPYAAGSSFHDETFDHEGVSRRYKLFVPSGGGRPLPLVVLLHGGTQSPDDFARCTQMNALAEQESFLVAYPEQSARANALRYWNWFSPSHQRRGTGEPALIAGITGAVLRDHAADPERLWVAGFSAGGAMAAVMAATYPDLYAAVGVHSGLAYGAARSVGSAFTAMKQGPTQDLPLPGRRIPLIVFHGDQDTTVSRHNADGLVRQWRASGGEGPAPEQTVHGPARVGGRSCTQVVHRGHGVEQWVVHGSGHAWSGGGPAASYTDPLGPSATATMLSFFQRHRR